MRDGRIAQLGGAMTGEQELDARGLAVLPGGITTIANMTFALEGQTMTEAVERR